MRRFPLVALLGLAVLLTSCGREPSAKLPPLGIDIKDTSVSGISSGAYMAGQFQFAHGDVVRGAAIIAGGPYGCAESAFSGMVAGPIATMLNANKAVSGCMLNAMALWGVPDVASLASKANDRAAAGGIDPIASVTSDRVYLFSGQNDRTVVPKIVARAAEFYRAIGVPAANIEFKSDLPAGHAFITEDEGGACAVTSEPYVADCDYDQAKELLEHIYGPLQPPSTTPRGKLFTFGQDEFTETIDAPAGLSELGAAYVPDACAAETCRVHIAFHGCAQNMKTVGDAFIKGAGFERWADSNRIVVLFPQASVSPSNPQGCWDWWGYSGRDYLTRSAPQIEAVFRMLQRMAGPRTG